MKKIVRTVELTWEKEVSVTVNRRRVWSNTHDQAVKGVDDDTGDRTVNVDQLELAVGNGEKAGQIELHSGE